MDKLNKNKLNSWLKKKMETKSNAFEIGLVLGGAASAGSYTAGVLDFLFEALESWEAAKKDENELPKKQRKIPPHNVKIDVIAGGSAGGMIAAMCAAELRSSPHKLVDINGLPKSTSRFYRAWVDEINLEKLLDVSDLKNGQRVKSILNSEVIPQVAGKLLLNGYNDPPFHREYISDNLKIILTLANLRGIPYDIKFEGDKILNYGMFSHRDYIIFQLDRDGALHSDDPSCTSEQAWQTLFNCGIAAGTFPIALAPQLICRKPYAFGNRKWFIPFKEKMKNGQLICTFKAEAIAPAWPPEIESDPNFDLRFLSLDGGIFNNEPFDLARRTMATSSMLIETDYRKIRNAILLIDPFPEIITYKAEYISQGYLTETIPQFIRALINQGRFKIEDIYLAKNENIYTRYMLTPKRDNNWTGRTLACGSLEGFSGLFDKEFRIHDYFLGKRNCQQFLKENFALPFDRKSKKNNPIFKDWNDAMINAYTIENSNGISHLPVIPLVGKARNRVLLYPYPTIPERSIDAYKPLLKKRISHVIKSLMRHDIMESKLIYTFMGIPLARLLSVWLTPKILKIIKNDFKSGQLIQE
ncbi:MAG: patatin-like phospholipase family protein [Acidobacteria bacterium]|jgi:predicted acylesterase/phospholipase RssA|nr:patatin-like phospholipase family protein [Acidobacteriota bacterium]